jgi:CrcB protein
MGSICLAALGGAGGAVCRSVLSRAIKRRWNTMFPAATFGINLIGSFLLGCLLARFAETWIFLLLGTGFCGGFTTFSTYQTEAAALLRGRQRMLFCFYWAGSVFCGMAAALAAIVLLS